MNKLKNNMTRIIAIFFVLLTLFNVTVIDVFAGDTVFLQCLIDSSSKKYQVTPVGDNNKEKRKLEYKTAQISKYVFSMCEAGDNGGESNKCYQADKTYPSTYSLGSGSSASDIWTATELMAGTGGSKNDIYISDKEVEEKVEGNKNYFKNVLTTGGTSMELSSTYFFKSSGTDRPKFLALSWPSDPKIHSAGTDEVNYATTVASTLSNSLNELVSTVNGGKKITDISRLMALSVALRPADSSGKVEVGSYVLYYKFDEAGKPSGDASAKIQEFVKKEKDHPGAYPTASGAIGSLPTYDDEGNLYVYLYPKSENTIDKLSAIVYAMPKGYRKTAGGKYSKTLMFKKGDGTAYSTLGEKDSAWVNIFMLSQYANAVYRSNGTTTGNVADAEEGNIIIKTIVDFAQSTSNYLLSLLGLKSTNELVYNRGLRGSSLFNYGTMSDNWWKTVLQYHLIFQAFAWFIIVCGFLKTCIALNLSRMNPHARETAYDSIKRFLVVGFGLVLIIPISQFLMSMNNSIVQVFASQVADVNSDIPPSVKGLAGIIFVFAYGIIRIYINFIYIMRSITIALLLVSAPFFIAVGAWSKSGYNNGLTSQWAKELIANIFMQSVHAFCLAFLINLMGQGSGLESFVISYSIIPITDMFRGLIFQGGGSSTISLGQSAADKGSKMVTSAATTAGGLAMGAVAKRINKKDGATTDGAGASGSGNGGGRGAQSGAGALNNAMNGKISELKDKIESGNGSGVDKAKIAGMRGLQAFGQFAGAAAGFGVGMMNAELSGNSMGYSDAGAAVGKGVGNAINNRVDRKLEKERRENNKVSAGRANSSCDTDQLGSFAASEDKEGQVHNSSKTYDEVKQLADSAKSSIKKGENLSADQAIGLAMQVAQNGTGSMSATEVANMKKATGFGSSEEAKEFLANKGMTVSGGSAHDETQETGGKYSYSVGNKSFDGLDASGMMSDGSTKVRTAIPKGNAVASSGADGSVNLTFKGTGNPRGKDYLSGEDNFKAFAMRNAGAKAMYNEMKDHLDAGISSGRLSNGVTWTKSDNGSLNFNYGRDYQKTNNISRMEVSHDGAYINSVTGNRDLSTIYGTRKTTASSPSPYEQRNNEQSSN